MNIATEPQARLDHVVVAAATLADGVAWCERTLGVTPGPGGEHPLMGTHNRLFNVSSARFPLCFFEIIAINPDAAPPQRARWFGFDGLDLSAGPRLVNLVARTPDIERHLARLAAAGARPGEALRATRQTAAGLLQWRIAVAADGRLDGALPTLIQWDDEARQPATRMPESGVRLDEVIVSGLPDAVGRALALEGAPLAMGAPGLELRLTTPHGPVTLRG